MLNLGLMVSFKLRIEVELRYGGCRNGECCYAGVGGSAVAWSGPGTAGL
jgi:hypothetical protein